MKSAKDRMDIISAYYELGSYRGAADRCGTTHRTVKKIIDKHEADQAGVPPAPRAQRPHNYDAVAELVTERVEKSQGRISAKRLLPVARAAGYEGRDVTSGASLHNQKQCGAATITVVAVRRCGHLASIW